MFLNYGMANTHVYHIPVAKPIHRVHNANPCIEAGHLPLRLKTATESPTALGKAIPCWK